VFLTEFTSPYSLNTNGDGTPQMATGDNIIRRMRLVCWMTKSRNTRLEYVILFLTLKQWLREHALILLSTFFA